MAGNPPKDAGFPREKTLSLSSPRSPLGKPTGTVTAPLRGLSEGLPLAGGTKEKKLVCQAAEDLF
jgi:hypothetical protein